MNLTQLRTFTEECLRTNICEFRNKRYLRAGAGLKLNLITRDFCFAAEALSKIGELEVIRDHLSLLIDYSDLESGLVPCWIGETRFFQILKRLIILKFKKTNANNLFCKDELDIRYSFWGRVVPIDLNALVALQAFRYYELSRDHQWWEVYSAKLVKIFSYYNKKFKEGLIYQDGGSDWQWTWKRKGYSFYTNLIYWHANSLIARFEVHPSQFFVNHHAKIFDSFYDKDSGLFKGLSDRFEISLEGNLLAIKWKFLADSELKKLYSNLKKHPIWQLGPGYVNYPSIPFKLKPWWVHLLGLSSYHDKAYWLWLMALSAEVASQMGDMEEYEKIIFKIEKVFSKYKSSVEVIKNNGKYKPLNSWILNSETMSSWAAAYVLNMLENTKSRFN